MTDREQIIAAAKDWWIDFQATHEDWRYADREAIIYGAFAAGAASRDAEIAELVVDAARYRHLRQDENFCVDEKSGEHWEPVHYEQLDAALDAALAKVRKP